MAILQKGLTALRKEFKDLEKKMEKLLKGFDSSPKPKKAAKPKAVKKAVSKKSTAKKAPAKKAPAKKAPAKKAAAQKKAVKKAPVKKAPAKKKAVAKAPAKKAPAPKKAVEVTATDQILKIIKRSKKGVDVPTLKEKTGFDDKKVRNIVFRAAKEGRIIKSGRGVYVGG
jgi:hypothetical protein